MEKTKVYPLFDFVENLELKNNLFNYFEIILSIVSKEGLTWPKYNTRSGSRYVSEIEFERNRFFIPADLIDIHEYVTIIVNELLKLANKTITDGSQLVPIQLFVCYYKDGSDVCPMHKHKCRQLTLSIGSDRIMNIEGKNGKEQLTLYNGSVVYLHSEKHGIPKDKNSNTGPRLSFNLFYTTSSELDPVQ